jgi:hypothetical protein
MTYLTETRYEEYYGYCTVLFSKNKKLVILDILQMVKVSFGGLNVYNKHCFTFTSKYLGLNL